MTKNYDQEQLGQFIWLPYLEPQSIERSQGRNPEVGTETGVMEAWCLLARSTCFHIQSRTKGGTAHSGLDLSILVINQENTPQIGFQANFFSTDVCSS